jgi:hypothetical protein
MTARSSVAVGVAVVLALGLTARLAAQADGCGGSVCGQLKGLVR